ncbi:MAG: hypothetical protein Q7S52_05885 [bacterium]|nr:hypothetical protein [bacterium]
MLRTLWCKIPPERQRLIVAMAVLACVVYLLDYFGNVAELYQPTYFFGYDKVVHFMAGAFCGTFGLWLFQPSGATKEWRYAFMTVALFAFWIGLGWEVYEVICNQPDLSSLLYWGDTVGDMITDVLGGIVAGLVFREKR